MPKNTPPPRPLVLIPVPMPRATEWNRRVMEWARG